MKLQFSPVVFAIVYCVVFVGVLSADAALFKYYPQTGRLAWGWMPLQGNGPGMAWYGLMANAAIAATLLALVIPEQKLAGALRNFLWLFPLSGMLGCVYLMKHFFLR